MQRGHVHSVAPTAVQLAARDGHVQRNSDHGLPYVFRGWLYLPTEQVFGFRRREDYDVFELFKNTHLLIVLLFIEFVLQFNSATLPFDLAQPLCDVATLLSKRI